MDKVEIIATISKDGITTFEVAGAKGSKCLDITVALERALGPVIERQRKPEFYQEEAGHVGLTAGGAA